MTSSSGSFSSPFSEADLHAFVDGRIEPVRQIEMTRRLRSLPADRARVEAWREQNELIRATFSEVESESVPVSLSLLPPARLRCVVSDVQTAERAPLPALGRPFQPSNKRRSRLLGLTAVTICGALAAAWIMVSQPPQAPPVRPVTAGDSDALLGSRVREALSHNQPASSGAKNTLPAIAIPNLANAGFDLIDAASDGKAVPALLLVYQDNNGQRLALGIAKTIPGTVKPVPGATPLRIGPTQIILWHRGGNSFALAGTLDQRRLIEIALLIQGPGAFQTDAVQP